MKGLGKITNYELRITKLENFSLFLWLLLIPTQLGKFFWPEWASVRGVRSDYLAPVLYLLDIVWIIWIGSRVLKSKSPKVQSLKRVFTFENLVVVIFIGLNILVAENRWVAAYKWLRIGQWVISLKVLKSESLKVKKYLRWVIPCWVMVESWLGFGQIIKGGSLEGVWYWLGERRFNLTTIGIAQLSWLGNGLVRAYGTFSHPNSLAGFLLLSLVVWKRYQKNFQFKIFNLKFNGVLWWVVVWSGTIGLIIAGSRMVWLVATVIVVEYLWKKTGARKMEVKNLIGMVIISVGVFVSLLGIIGVNYRVGDFLGGWDKDSLTKRVMLNITALEMWKENIFLGVGAGNFVAELPSYQLDKSFYWLQPAHNIFLLAGAELGMLGIVMMAKFLIFNFEFLNKKKNWLVLGIIIITGMVDHYWLTLPQNYWLLAVVFGIL